MSSDESSSATPAPKRPLRNKQQLDECFAQAMRLFKHDRHYDYAHTLLVECVIHDPANVGYAETLLANLTMRSKRKRRTLLRRAPATAHAVSKAAADQQWTAVLRLGIETISIDPWHVPTLRLMAQACAQLHFPEVELVYLKQALVASPKDAEVNRHCAQSLARVGQFDQAIACWHRIETLTGKNDEAAAMISRLAQEKLLHSRGRPPAREAAITTAPSHPQVERLPEPVAAQDAPLRLTHRQALEQKIDEDPANVTNYFELAEFLCDQEQFDQAEATLARARDNCAQTSAVDERLVVARRRHTDFVRAAEDRVRADKARREAKRRGFPVLETILGAAGVALVVQFVPGLASRVLELAVNHVWLVSFIANAILMAILLVIRVRSQQT